MSVSISVLAGAGWQFLDNNANPLSGGLIYTYDAGTTTPRTTYTSSTGLTANANPIVLDSAGRTPQEVWLTSGVRYKLAIYTSANVLIGTYDNVYGVADADSGQILFVPAGTGAVNTTVQAKLREYVSLEDYDTLRNALAQNKRVQVSPSTASISVSTTDSPYVLPYLYLVDAEADLTISLATGVHTTTADNISNIGQNENITLLGATTAATTLSSVSSVTGTSGNYTVDLVVASAANIAVGNYLKLDNVTPLLTLSGDNSVFRARIVDNELLQCSALLGNATCTTSGTSVVFASVDAGYVLSNIIQVNDLITIKGQTRQVTVVTDGTRTLTVDVAWTLGTTGTRGYWVSKPNTGTISTASAVHSGTVSTGGVSSTTVTGSSTLFSTEAAVNDLIQVGTATTKITAIASDTSITVSPAITITAASSYLIIKPTTAVTGTSSLFTTEANVGDMLLTNGTMSIITAIGGATGITVSPAVTVPDGSEYSVITNGLAHEGTYQVVNVVGTTITVTNLWRGIYAPPIKRISGGDVKIIKTVLRNTGSGDGLSFRQNSAIKMVDDLVLLGNNVSASTHGIALNGRTTEGPTQLGYVGIINGGSGLAVISWGRGAFIGHGCTLQTRKTHYCGNRSFGVYALEGSSAILRECVISGTIGRGMQLNANSTTKFTEGYSVGNTSDGAALEIGATLYAEIPGFYQNGSMGIRVNGAAGVHINEGAVAVNYNSGVYAVSGAIIDMERLLLACNGRENIEIYDNSSVAASEIWSTGSTGATGSGYGMDILDSEVVADDCAIIGNAGGPGIFNGPNASLNAPRSYIQGNTSNGIFFDNYAIGILTNGVVEAVSVDLGASLQVAGVSPVPVLTGVARLNEVSNKGAVVKNDSSTDGFGVARLRINGGAKTTTLTTFDSTVAFGSIGAGATSTQTVSATGVTTSMSVFVSVSNSSSSVTDGVFLNAGVISADTITVTATNITGGSITMTKSLRFLIMGFA